MGLVIDVSVIVVLNYAGISKHIKQNKCAGIVMALEKIRSIVIIVWIVQSATEQASKSVTQTMGAIDMIDGLIVEIVLFVVEMVGEMA